MRDYHTSVRLTPGDKELLGNLSKLLGKSQSDVLLTALWHLAGALHATHRRETK